jgi:hypothetical protein
MSTTNNELADLARFGRLPEGKVFVDLLHKRLAEHDQRLRTATGEELIRTQGKAQAVEQLIKDITQAPTNLQRALESRAPRLATL